MNRLPALINRAGARSFSSPSAPISREGYKKLMAIHEQVVQELSAESRAQYLAMTPEQKQAAYRKYLSSGKLYDDVKKFAVQHTGVPHPEDNPVFQIACVAIPTAIITTWAIRKYSAMEHH
eukprot:GILI01000137.1.p1 GENE.GILI01000137.1~~GILI01000137.1.p1  ORF type:complete len:128 (+),score=52.05 GILI01000137.1:22-384(+)